MELDVTNADGAPQEHEAAPAEAGDAQAAIETATSDESPDRAAAPEDEATPDPQPRRPAVTAGRVVAETGVYG